MQKIIVPTTDITIRHALIKFLHNKHLKDKKVRIFEELGVKNGHGRIDIAVINGIIHGYEIKSDQDTLQRLPEQIKLFSSVFDKMTLVVGKTHLYNAIKIIPDWWGIVTAKNNENNSIRFNTIREPGVNNNQSKVSVAQLLWKQEAIKILEEINEATGLYSKPRNIIYETISKKISKKVLNKKVREILFFREDWRPDEPLMINGG
jgi:hypothetical protein